MNAGLRTILVVYQYFYVVHLKYYSTMLHPYSKVQRGDENIYILLSHGNILPRNMLE